MTLEIHQLNGYLLVTSMVYVLTIAVSTSYWLILYDRWVIAAGQKLMHGFVAVVSISAISIFVGLSLFYILPAILLIKIW